MTDLDKLIEAVEANALPEAVFHGSSSIRGHWAYITGLDAEQRRWVYLAYNGSLDAAKRLHEALLPGWDYCIDYVQRVKPLVYVQDDGGPTHDGEAETPARAWLLAILRALKAKGDA